MRGCEARLFFNVKTDYNLGVTTKGDEGREFQEVVFQDK